jgi:hypothetical protein
MLPRSLTTQLLTHNTSHHYLISILISHLSLFSPGPGAGAVARGHLVVGAQPPGRGGARLPDVGACMLD